MTWDGPLVTPRRVATHKLGLLIVVLNASVAVALWRRGWLRLRAVAIMLLACAVFVRLDRLETAPGPSARAGRRQRVALKAGPAWFTMNARARAVIQRNCKGALPPAPGATPRASPQPSRPALPPRLLFPPRRIHRGDIHQTVRPPGKVRSRGQPARHRAGNRGRRDRRLRPAVGCRGHGRRPARIWSSSRATRSRSSATRWPTGCSTTAGSRPTLQPLPRARPGDPQPRLLGRRADPAAPLGRLRHARRVADRGPRPTCLRLLRLQRVVRRRRRTGHVQRPSSTPSSSTRSTRSTTARRRRGWSCSRRSRTRTCTTRNLPDGAANNARLKLYTAAMAEVARPTTTWPSSTCSRPRLALYAKESKPLTINGVHLNELGDRRVAEIDRRGAVRRAEACPRAIRAARAASPGGPRQELLLVQPLSHGRRLLDLRRPGRPEVRRRPDQPRGRAARDGSARRDDRQPRPAHLGRRRGRRPAWSTTATRPRSSRSRPTSPGRGPTASTSSWAARKPSAR